MSALSRIVELYQRDVVALIRGAGTNLSILSDRALSELWGWFSCEVRNRFWARCDTTEVCHFAEWADGKPAIAREVEKAVREAALRKQARAAARRSRPPVGFVLPPDADASVDRSIRVDGVHHFERHRVPREPLMTIHELTDSINRWCAEQGVMPTARGSKLRVDEQMIRYCCKYSLLDSPGAPDGRSRGFSEKHACQLRAIRLLQARSLSLTDINTIIHGRTIPQLREIEHEELCLLKGVKPVPHEALKKRMGAPRWV